MTPGARVELDPSETDARIAEILATVGIGHLSRCSDSALTRGCHISHATEIGGDRTLCGRDASRWSQDPAFHGGPDCLRCRRVWNRRLRRDPRE